MAHTGDGHIYIDTSVNPPMGIDIRGDIAYVLGVNTGDIGYAITHGNINPFAKYKPVRLNTVNTGNNANWWKAQDGNCGLTPYSASNYVTVANSLDAGTMNGWVYSKPTGGTASPFRVMDFKGYYHYAIPLADGIEAIDQVSPGTPVVVTLLLQQDDSEELTLSDMSLSQCYFCLYIKKKDSNAAYILTGDKCNTGSASATFVTTSVAQGDWIIYPMLSTAPIAQASSFSGSSTFYSIPYTGPKELKISSVTPATHYLTVQAEQPSAGSVTINYSFQFTNTTAGNLLKPVTIRLRDASKAYDDTMLSYEVEQSAGPQQTSGGTFTYTGTITATQQMIQSGVQMKLWVRTKYSGDGVTYTQSAEVAIPQE